MKQQKNSRRNKRNNKSVKDNKISKIREKPRKIYTINKKFTKLLLNCLKNSLSFSSYLLKKITDYYSIKKNTKPRYY